MCRGLGRVGDFKSNRNIAVNKWKYPASTFAVGKNKIMGFMKNLIVIGLLSGACLVGVAQERDKASYRLCDFHQHTTFSDGV